MGESGHSPALVGKHFIMNYYTILHDEPQLLYKFYKDDSVYSFGIEGEPLSPESTVTGQSNINEKIASLGFKKCKVHLSVVDAQPTLGGGVLLMVKGTIINDGTSRKFVQTFLLAQQPSGYYVRNDILRYLADQDQESGKTITTSSLRTEAETAVSAPAAEKPKDAAPVEEAKPTMPVEPEQPAQAAAAEISEPQQPEQPKETPAPATPAPVAAAEEPKEAPAPSVAPVAATPAPAAAAAPAAAKASPAAKPARGGQAGRGKGKEDKTRSTTAPASETPAAAPKESSPADGSWAALAARKKDAPVTPLPAAARQPSLKAPAKKPAPAATPAAAAAPATAAASSEEAAAAPAVPKEDAAPAPEQPAPADEKPVSDPNSIYVSNLPFAAKRSQVADVFKAYGKIAFVSMQSDKGFAFIEYETVEAAQNAIKLATENPISMDGRVLRVEERKTKRSGGSGRKVPGGRGSDRVPRGPRPEGKERAAGSPRPNGSERRERRDRGEKRAPGTGSPAAGRPAAGGASSGAQPKRAAPAAAPVAGGATGGKK